MHLSSPGILEGMLGGRWDRDFSFCLSSSSSSPSPSEKLVSSSKRKPSSAVKLCRSLLTPWPFSWPEGKQDVNGKWPVQSFIKSRGLRTISHSPIYAHIRTVMVENIVQGHSNRGGQWGDRTGNPSIARRTPTITNDISLGESRTWLRYVSEFPSVYYKRVTRLYLPTPTHQSRVVCSFYVQFFIQ